MMDMMGYKQRVAILIAQDNNACIYLVKGSGRASRGLHLRNVGPFSWEKHHEHTSAQVAKLGAVHSWHSLLRCEAVGMIGFKCTS